MFSNKNLIIKGLKQEFITNNCLSYILVKFKLNLIIFIAIGVQLKVKCLIHRTDRTDVSEWECTELMFINTFIYRNTGTRNSLFLDCYRAQRERERQSRPQVVGFICCQSCVALKCDIHSDKDSIYKPGITVDSALNSRMFFTGFKYY